MPTGDGVGGWAKGGGGVDRKMITHDDVWRFAAGGGDIAWDAFAFTDFLSVHASPL